MAGHRVRANTAIPGLNILLQLTEAMLAIDFSGSIFFQNEAARRLFGGYVTAPVPSWVDELLQDQVVAELRRTGSWRAERLQTSADRGERLLDIHATLLMDDDREAGFLCVLRDITAQRREDLSQLWIAKQAKESALHTWAALRHDAKVLDNFLENIPLPVYVKDSGGRHIFHNLAARKAIPRFADAVGKTDRELFAARTAREFREHDEAAIDSARPVHTIEVLPVNGEQRTFVSVRFPIQSEAGQRFLGGLSIDITESVRDQENLRRQAALLNLIRDAIFVTDLNGVITYWNTAATRLYEMTDAEVLGRRCSDLPNHGLPQVDETKMAALSEDGCWEQKTVRYREDGSAVDVLSRWSLLRDLRGEPTARLVVNIDLTSTTYASNRPQQAEAIAQARGKHLLTEARRIAKLGTWAWDLAGGEVSWSAEIYRIFEREPGLLPASIDGWQDCLADTSYAALVAAKERLVRSGSSFRIDLECRLAGSNKKWVTVCGKVKRRSGAAVTELSGTLEEISESMMAETTLRRSEEQLRLGAKVARLALAQVDYPGGWIHLSAEAAELFGLGIAAMSVAREVVHAVFHPEDRAEFERRINEHLDPESSGWFEMDNRIVRADGSLRWIRVRKDVYCDGDAPQRHARRGILAAFDITAEKQAFESLRRSEASFRELAESLPQLVWVANPSGSKTYCNQRYLEYTGAASPDEINQLWVELIHPDDQEETSMVWKAACENRQPYIRQYRLRRHDGVYRYFLARAHPVLHADGAIERWLGSSTDVHDRKLAEDALRRSEKLAVAGRLAATVAHEINNPLAAVTNLLYLLGSHASLDRTARDYVRIAQQELARVSEITTNTLRFHKSSSSLAPARIAEILDSVLVLFKARINSARIELVRDYRRTEPLTCMAGEIRQAVANVLGNALDATPPGGRVIVRLRPGREWRQRDQMGLRITIADSGAGIARERLASIFEPFCSTKGITGSGLGLWITHDLIHNHEGVISVRSSIAGDRPGSVFSLFLPFEPAGGIERTHNSGL